MSHDGTEFNNSKEVLFSSLEYSDEMTNDEKRLMIEDHYYLY